jgi:hypothetical protein
MLPTPRANVVFQRIDDGAVLFAPDTEIYFGLNEVGAKVWEHLIGAVSSLDDLCARIAADYPEVPEQTVRADVTELLDQLAAEGLLAPPAATGPDAVRPS